MSLFLYETNIQDENITKEALQVKINSIQTKLEDTSNSLIEVQIAKDLSQLFLIVETKEVNNVATLIEDEGFEIKLQKEVRLVGEDLEKVKQQNESVNYVVEWNLPEHLTMEKYLERKKQNSVHYAEVPEVSFQRTYVCEDMTKCLCFYDAPDEAAVKRAREAVQAPIDAITEREE